jgi:hypothetical protein
MKLPQSCYSVTLIWLPAPYQVRVETISLASLEPLAEHYQSHGFSSMRIVLKMTGFCI